MIEEKTKIAFICNACGKNNHEWHEVYYEEGARLIKAEKSYITWCKQVKGYIITNTRI